MPSELPLRIVTAADYDHVADLLTGQVVIAGVAPHWVRMHLLDVLLERDRWDVAEASFGKYCELVAAGDDTITAVPVFQSRVFRHSSFYARDRSGIETPADLKGRRVGVPDWSQTAVIYARGLLADEYGVGLGDVEWTQGGLDEPQRSAYMRFPPGVTGALVADRSLSAMLADGALDAVIAARPPAGFGEPGSPIKRLFPDSAAEEKRYYARTGVFPIMHSLVVKRELIDRHDWLAGALLDAFTRARDRSLTRLANPGISHLPLPWVPEAARERWSVLGPARWPYGVAENRVTLDAFFRYAHEQGVCARRLRPDEVFADVG